MKVVNHFSVSYVGWGVLRFPTPAQVSHPQALLTSSDDIIYFVLLPHPNDIRSPTWLAQRPWFCMKHCTWQRRIWDSWGIHTFLQSWINLDALKDGNSWKWHQMMIWHNSIWYTQCTEVLEPPETGLNMYAQCSALGTVLMMLSHVPKPYHPHITPLISGGQMYMQMYTCMPGLKETMYIIKDWQKSTTVYQEHCNVGPISTRIWHWSSTQLINVFVYGDRNTYLFNILPLMVISKPDTIWSCISPLRGVPSLGTRYWWCVDTAWR